MKKHEESLRKKESLGQSIDDKGQLLLQNKLPDNKTIKLKFIPQPKSDFGIDGEIQVFRNKKYVGEDYKLQLKSTGSPKYLKGGKKLSISLDLSSVWSMARDIKSPIALIIADVKNDKVYWCAIQTDDKIQRDLDKKLKSSNEISKDQSITIHIDAANEITPQKYQPLYDYYQEAKVKLARVILLETKTNPVLGAGMEFIDKIESQTYDIEGFTWRLRNSKDQPPEHAVFSVTYGKDKTIDYFVGKDFDPSLAPRVKLTTKFSTRNKTDSKRADKYQDVLKGGSGSIELSDSNIDSFKVMVGQNILSDSSQYDSTKISIGPSIQKKQQTVILDNGKEELQNKVEIWYHNNNIHIQSVEGQAFNISTSFAPEQGDSTTFKIQVDNSKLTNVSQELHLMEFMKFTNQLEIGIIDNQGFKKKLFAGDINGSNMVSKESYNFVKALSEIQESTGVPILYPLPDKLNRDELNNVYWIHRLVTQGKVIKDVTFTFALSDKNPPKDLQEGGAMMMTQNPPEIYLFGKPYILPGHKQEIKGTISKLEKVTVKGEKKYRARLKEAEFIFERTQ